MAGLLLLRSPPHNTAMARSRQASGGHQEQQLWKLQADAWAPGEGCPAVTPPGHGVGACGTRHEKMLDVTQHSVRRERVQAGL